jgi:hypothetical protein
MTITKKNKKIGKEIKEAIIQKEKIQKKIENTNKNKSGRENLTVQYSKSSATNKSMMTDSPGTKIKTTQKILKKDNLNLTSTKGTKKLTIKILITNKKIEI